MSYQQMKWILASGSPRRKELLTQIGLEFEVLVSEADENIEEDLSPGELVERLSLIKAEAVRASLRSRTEGVGGENVSSPSVSGSDNYGIIGADTIVYHDGKVLGKPKDEDDAFAMLRALSGGSHSVFTGVSILLPDETITFHNETKVYFDELSDEEIHKYIASGEPMDKAGAYGIQGLGGAFVTRIEGEYANVVGFPIGHFCKVLRDKDIL